MQIFLALFMRPADELVARRALPSGSTKAQQCDQAIPGIDPLTQLRTGEGCKAKIVIAVYVFVPQTGIRAVADLP